MLRDLNIQKALCEICNLSQKKKNTLTLVQKKWHF